LICEIRFSNALASCVPVSGAVLLCVEPAPVKFDDDVPLT
jgi:hypothetical protein